MKGIWLRKIGDKVQVLVQYHLGEDWRILIEENSDDAFSHIVEDPQHLPMTRFRPDDSR